MDLEMWQRNLDQQAALSAAAAIFAASQLPCVHPELETIDQEVIDLCLEYSEVDILASEAMSMPDPEERFLHFTDMIVKDLAVEESYSQFLKLTDKLIEELMSIGWGHSLDNLERLIGPIKYAHEMQDLPSMASILMRTMTNLRVTCESSAHNAMKVKHNEAGELFLLTVLAARELHNALALSPAAVS